MDSDEVCGNREEKFFSFIGLRKRFSVVTVGCESGEADPVGQEENLLLRSNTPTFSRGGDLRDPAADAPHDSLVDRVFGKQLLF